MFQLILLAVVIYVLSRWLRRGPAPTRPERRQRDASPQKSPPGQVEEMVQDPLCGTWVPLSQAVTLRQGGETLNFCSPECREKFQLTPKAD